MIFEWLYIPLVGIFLFGLYWLFFPKHNYVVSQLCSDNKGAGRGVTPELSSESSNRTDSAWRQHDAKRQLHKFPPELSVGMPQETWMEEEPAPAPHLPNTCRTHLPPPGAARSCLTPNATVSAEDAVWWAVFLDGWVMWHKASSHRSAEGSRSRPRSGFVYLQVFRNSQHAGRGK